jgi:hypothetical protein
VEFSTLQSRQQLSAARRTANYKLLRLNTKQPRPLLGAVHRLLEHKTNEEKHARPRPTSNEQTPNGHTASHSHTPAGTQREVNCNAGGMKRRHTYVRTGTAQARGRRPAVAEAGERQPAAGAGGGRLAAPVAAPPAGALAPVAQLGVGVVVQLEPAQQHPAEGPVRRRRTQDRPPVRVQHRRHHHVLAPVLVRLGARDPAVRQHVRPTAIILLLLLLASAQLHGGGQGDALLAVVEEGDVGVGGRGPQPGGVDGEVHADARAAGRRVVLVADVGVRDQHGTRLVVDAGHYVSVGHVGEGQRRVALADKADPVAVAAVGRRGVEPERVLDDMAGACGSGAGTGDGVGYCEGELDGEEEQQEQRSHRNVLV